MEYFRRSPIPENVKLFKKAVETGTSICSLTERLKSLHQKELIFLPSAAAVAVLVARDTGVAMEVVAVILPCRKISSRWKMLCIL
nr:MAG TPA: hypothetical protein [Caudoviricetes sp.]